MGELYVNGQRTAPSTRLQPGDRVLRTAALTAGIRATSIYVEASAMVIYFCTCYVAVDLRCVVYKSKKDMHADNHQANYI